MKRSFLLSAVALLILPGGAVAAKQDVAPALAPEQLVNIRAFLVGAGRAEVSLLSGARRTGKIEAVTEKEIVLKTRARRNRGPWRIETIATDEVRHVRLFHTAKKGWRSRVGKTLGLVAGLTVAGPVMYHAAEAGHGIAAWAAIVVIPALGALAGERLTRPTQETLVPILRQANAGRSTAANEDTVRQ